MGVSRSFLELLEFHQELEEIFFRHQEALLSLDIDHAVAILALYEEKLLSHMDDEERFLLPRYQERAGVIPGGPVELFLGEHRKMRMFIAEFHQALDSMKSEERTPLRRSIVRLLDRQFMYKHLVEHHDLREKNILYPWLDRITSDEEREVLLKQCERSGAKVASRTVAV